MKEIKQQGAIQSIYLLSIKRAPAYLAFISDNEETCARLQDRYMVWFEMQTV
jgi:hypothetical protein